LLALKRESLIKLVQAIVAPFWHEETIAASETISPVICVASIALSIIAAGVLYFVGPFWC
jgi:hypothetical protein